jgi:hypothetical protein
LPFCSRRRRIPRSALHTQYVPDTLLSSQVQYYCGTAIYWQQITPWNDAVLSGVVSAAQR